MIKQAIYDPESLWQQFSDAYNLTESQLSQFKKFYELLNLHNTFYNLTTVVELKSVIQNHFQDSLALTKLYNLNEINSIVDVGSGGGFPGIPLKIVYPHLNVILIEVIHKKAEFLNTIIKELGLQHIATCTYDWRTFLRKVNTKVDIFCARASLAPQELLRMFKPSSIYKESKLVYWASNNWIPTEDEKQFIVNQVEYEIGSKKRRLILFDKNIL